MPQVQNACKIFFRQIKQRKHTKKKTVKDKLSYDNGILQCTHKHKGPEPWELQNLFLKCFKELNHYPHCRNVSTGNLLNYNSNGTNKNQT